MAISLRMRPGFRLIHEPLGGRDASVSMAEEAVARMLSNRVANSSSGTFLITGFRGVGKTTAVQQALRELEATTGVEPISITIPVGRPTETSTLLFEVIRRLVDRMTELGVLARLSPAVSKPLLTAYARTSLAYRETASESSERGHTVGVSAPTGKLAVKLGLKRSWKQAESRATEISFLAYSEADAEHDFLRIVALLRSDNAELKGRMARLGAKLRIASATKRFDAPIVIVFDEIDKLTSDAQGRESFEALLGGLKNLLGTGGAHFVVVAGVDLHDEWLRESATPDSLYRSVFAWQGYVGCSWDVAELLLEKLAIEEPSDGRTEAIGVLSGYLEYRGRGIIRNVLYELNELVDWDEGGAFIDLSGVAEKRVRLLASLTDAIREALESATNPLLAAPSVADRVRQVAFFTSDWVLRSGGEPFTVNDVLDTAGPSALAPVLNPSPETVREVLLGLVAKGHLRVEVRDDATITQGPGSEAADEHFRLAPELLDQLTAIARSSPRGRGELGSAGKLDRPSGGELRAAVQDMLNSRGDRPRYELVELLGRGGFATVWRGVEEGTGRQVAVKDVRSRTPEIRRRAEAEGKLLTQLTSDDVQGMAKLVEAVYSEERVVIITELVEGNTLADLAGLDPTTAVDIVQQILRTLNRLHERGIVHADLKPSNVVGPSRGPVVILDLGAAVTTDGGRQESKYAFPSEHVGTPAYRAPEFAMGATPDPRSDVWAAGLILLQLLSGDLPADRSAEGIGRAIAALEVSRKLKEALRMALHQERGMRPNASQLLARLSSVPESRIEADTHPDEGSSSD
jgi:Cdc6-like AAA superfamily ATPase